MARIFVENTEIRIVTYLEKDFISLTDMAKSVKAELLMLLKTGSETDIHLSFWVHGKSFFRTKKTIELMKKNNKVEEMIMS